MKTTKSYGVKECAWCGESFTAHRANMVFCQQECCRLATNQKLIQKYHDNKLKKLNKSRQCACGAKLSIYNKEETCHACQLRSNEQQRNDLLSRLGFEIIDE